MPAPIAASTPSSSAGVAPKNAPGSDGHRVVDDDRDHEADECGRQHHALDADVDDAAPLVHDAAHRTEGDRRRESQDRSGRGSGISVDQVADELEDERRGAGVW